ncbi:MAG TPA: helix-turn-helix domain-containing protein [Solirubrobacteraceae bacterium]|nr:helix-turn-helix domain-containing protein [Solirubrobacteraceae bacterium]
MADEKLLSVIEVAEEFQVTDQTIRNWIKSGALKAIKIGRDHRIRRQDVDELLSRAQAESTSLATRRDIWEPQTMGLPHRRSESHEPPSVWDDEGDVPLPSKRS